MLFVKKIIISACFTGKIPRVSSSLRDEGVQRLTRPLVSPAMRLSTSDLVT
jgi:hypothetical protein